MSALAIVSKEPKYTLLSGHPASDHQAAIFDALADPAAGSKLVIAVAGAGKTTVIKNGLRYIPSGSHVQGFAFNTDAGRNLKAGLKEVIEVDGPERYKNVRMGTFHSVCFAALLRFWGVKADAVKVNGSKIRHILKAKLTDSDHEKYAAFVAKLVALAKGEGIGALCVDEEWRWFALVEHHGLYLDAEDASIERAVEIARKTLSHPISGSNAVAKTKHEIDFDDMLYLVLLWKLRLWQNDLVFVDEAQDTNPVRRAIVRLALKKGGRLYAVGDPKQSIFGFTGASTDAMELLRTEFNCTELPLTVSYRCARAVVRQAREWVDYIEPADTAPEGEVRHGVPLVDALKLLTQDDAVLCRQTAPLVDLAYRLISQSRGCRVLGREIGEGLVALIKAMKAKGVDRLVEKLNAFRLREVARFVAKGEEARAEAVDDRVDCMMTIVRSLPETARTMPELERRILALFDDTALGVLTLATVHKAKGQEWPIVAVLRPDLMPSKAARTDWARDQEVNLQYVAATRTKQCLLYLAVEK